ncbi:MAG TPA: nitrous oxide-stimulated promoter family protein [Syntrophales bacterium]|nr:nitrous oxide-stimulated promoter family protein [Syntrophales bacterium]HOX93168.1 nitrous oxide-stimulated promoter family protein [Syntrophales bacterium]HPI57653.1 nitrous oxide-stimulated promoter family protein [Syntrophales bacterium]HPN25334.1 nitrous oxide-stimulated promoter family protein [Syntrophales bacterium]HQM29626.1 nitrous oxide-stimulated promoter family protein [Syntrophales bacterium]
MPASNSRIKRETRTVEAMIGIYCRDLHGTKADLCPACLELLTYSTERLAQCPFQQGKTTCVRCPVHCFRPVMRGKIQAVMRLAGPRMPYRHPLLALCHFLDSRRSKPVKPREDPKKGGT